MFLCDIFVLKAKDNHFLDINFITFPYGLLQVCSSIVFSLLGFFLLFVLFCLVNHVISQKPVKLKAEQWSTAIAVHNYREFNTMNRQNIRI